MAAPLILLGLLALAGAAPRAAAETFMTVSDVPVDVTAKSAAAARDQAIVQAQLKAFDRLLAELVPNQEDRARLQPTTEQVEGFVQDFAVESERASPVRYIGRYTVRFRASLVRQYLAESGIEGVGPLRQVLVLPVYKGADGTLLWGQANRWRAAWEEGGYGGGPVTLILPNGDAYDTGSAPAAAVETGSMAALVPLIQRYRTAGAVVVEAAPSDPAKGPGSGLVVTILSFDITGPKGTRTLTVAADKGEFPGKVLRQGVAAAAAALEADWQQAIQTSGGIGLTGASPAADAALGPGTLYPIAMTISDLADWTRTRDQLARLPGVRGLSLDAVTRSAAVFTLDFAGDPLALETVLASNGFVLVQTAVASASGPDSYELTRAAPIPGEPPTAAGTGAR